MFEDFDRCYRAVRSKDARFDGMFITGVTSTGIYCRPSCPAITPKRSNIIFFPTAAAAQGHGLRACKRCRPDASPGSPEWDIRAGIAGRAMRLIADGVVDRDGVEGLASRLHLSERHLHRTLVSELGAGPQALARAHRTQTARVLIETTDLSFSAIAFASGFTSIRQFNDTVRAVFAAAPTELRARRKAGSSSPGEIELRLPYRAPLAADELFSFLGERAVPGIEHWDGTIYRRTLDLPHSPGTVALSAADGYVRCKLRLEDVRDLTAAVQRCRRLLDLDADPIAVAEVLSRDKALAPIVRDTPGVRVPGAVDGTELAVRAVLGQQISVRGARTLAARIVAELGKPLTAPEGDLTRLFPTPDVLAEADLSGIGLTGARQRALASLASAIAAGDIAIDPGAEREQTRARLLELPGIGPWTASYIALRALGDPDAFMATDLGVKHALAAARVEGDPVARAESWRPWRAYAQQCLWTSLGRKERK
jgi:AraC family transcriptional regulator of adaptative response / DNA-3-methyladenine glycosylase II